MVCGLGLEHLLDATNSVLKALPASQTTNLTLTQTSKHLTITQTLRLTLVPTPILALIVTLTLIVALYLLMTLNPSPKTDQMASFRDVRRSMAPLMQTRPNPTPVPNLHPGPKQYGASDADKAPMHALCGPCDGAPAAPPMACLATPLQHRL